MAQVGHKGVNPFTCVLEWLHCPNDADWSSAGIADTLVALTLLPTLYSVGAGSVATQFLLLVSCQTKYHWFMSSLYSTARYASPR